MYSLISGERFISFERSYYILIMYRRNTMNLETAIGLTHCAWTVFIAIYAFIISKARGYDFYYMGYMLLLVISWLLCKDECLVTYVYKIMLNPNYVLGQDANRLSDSEAIFGKTPMSIFININMLFTISSIYLVNKRNNFAPSYLWILFILCFTIYLFIMRKFYAPKFYETYLKKYNPAFRILFFGITCLYLWFLVIGGKNAYLG